MAEILVTAIIACATGAAVAWPLRSSQSKATHAQVEAQLAWSRKQNGERGDALAAVRDEHARCPETLALERERRAGAESQACRVPPLEADLVGTRAALSIAHACIAELQTALTQPQHASEEKLPLLNDAQLRAVAHGWPEEALAQNAQELAALGKQLYDRIAKLAEHWGSVGERLGKAVDAYSSATGTLESRVLVAARRFQDLQAAPQDVEIDVIEPVERAPRMLQAVAIAIARKDDKKL